MPNKGADGVELGVDNHVKYIQSLDTVSITIEHENHYGRDTHPLTAKR